MPIVSFREYGRMRGISLQAVQNRIKYGSISPSAIVHIEGKKHPKIDSDIADADFKLAAELKPEILAPPLLGNETPEPLEPEVDPIEEMFGPPPKESLLSKKVEIERAKTETKIIHGKETKVHVEPAINPDSHLYFNKYRKAKAGTEELKSRKLELEVARVEGKLLDKEDVKKTIEKLVSVTREKLLNLPSKISPDLVAIKSLIEMENKLLFEINNALEDLQKLGGSFE